MSASVHPPDDDVTPLESMSTRELLAELARLQDRLERDATAGGYRPLPGQMHRRAELERRERRIARELERRADVSREEAGQAPPG